MITFEDWMFGVDVVDVIFTSPLNSTLIDFEHLHDGDTQETC